MNEVGDRSTYFQVLLQEAEPTNLYQVYAGMCGYIEFFVERKIRVEVKARLYVSYHQ